MSEASVAIGKDERAALILRVKLISWLGLTWMTTEGVIGVTAGVMANSIALIGYGLASIVIIWRFTGHRVHSDDAERRAQKVVAVTFFLLAPYILVGAAHHLLTG